MRMLKVGHRGARVYEPENTLRSFGKALPLLKVGQVSLGFPSFNTARIRLSKKSISTIKR